MVYFTPLESRLGIIADKFRLTFERVVNYDAVMNAMLARQEIQEEHIEMIGEEKIRNALREAQKGRLDWKNTRLVNRSSSNSALGYSIHYSITPSEKNSEEFEKATFDNYAPLLDSILRERSFYSEEVMILYEPMQVFDYDQIDSAEFSPPSASAPPVAVNAVVELLNVNFYQAHVIKRVNQELPPNLLQDIRDPLEDAAKLASKIEALFWRVPS